MPSDEDFRRRPDPKEQLRLAMAGQLGDSQTAKRHKYGVAAKADRTVDGIVFDSLKEARFYVAIKRLEAAGIVSDLELQPEFVWDNISRDPETGREFVTRQKYRADFAYTEAGQRRYVDVKGYRTRTYRRKKRIVEAVFGVTIEEV